MNFPRLLGGGDAKQSCLSFLHLCGCLHGEADVYCAGCDGFSGDATEIAKAEEISTVDGVKCARFFEFLFLEASGFEVFVRHVSSC